METIICKQLNQIMKTIQDVKVKFNTEIKIIKKTNRNKTGHKNSGCQLQTSEVSLTKGL